MLLAVAFLVAALLSGTTVAGALFVGATSASHDLATDILRPPTSPAAAAGTCTPLVSDSIVVSWTASPSTWADGYEVLRSLTSGGPYTVVATVSGQASQSYTDTPLAFDTTYHYVVRATKGSWRSAPTAQVSRRTRTTLCAV